MLLFQLAQFQSQDLPLAVWKELPLKLYQTPHLHDCYEVVLIEQGTGWCSVNGHRFPMLRGDLYVMGSSDMHEFSGNPGLEFYNVMFSETLLPESDRAEFAELLAKPGKYTFAPAVSSKLLALLEELTRELRAARPGWRLGARALFVQFLLEVVRGQSGAGLVDRSGDSKQLSRILDLIARRCQEKLTLADLARLTGSTPEYAGRQFKRRTGLTFTEYLGRYRIEQARKLLEHSDASISEIAAELGYFDASYFNRQFRKALGITPRVYRSRSKRLSC